MFSSTPIYKHIYIYIIPIIYVLEVYWNICYTYLERWGDDLDWTWVYLRMLTPYFLSYTVVKRSISRQFRTFRLIYWVTCRVLLYFLQLSEKEIIIRKVKYGYGWTVKLKGSGGDKTDLHLYQNVWCYIVTPLFLESCMVMISVMDKGKEGKLKPWILSLPSHTILAFHTISYQHCSWSDAKFVTSEPYPI